MHLGGRRAKLRHELSPTPLSREAHYALRDRAASKGIIFLSTPFSREAADFLETVGVPYAYVLTKTDKLKRSALAQQTARIRAAVAPAVVLASSSQTGTGVEMIWRWIRAAIETEPEE